MACSGLHCAGCGAGSGLPVVALIALEGATWVAAHVIEVAVVSAACGALAVAAVAALMRAQDRRQAAFAARGPLLITRPDAAPLPQARRRELPPAVTNYYVITDAGTVARVIPQAVTNTQLPPGNQD